jgi:hypothetical protein
MATRRAPALAVHLSAADLALAVFGPWDARAEIEPPSNGPLWHPRVATGRLEAMLERHRAAIEATAAAAGVGEPWVVTRLAFVRDVHGH